MREETQNSVNLKLIVFFDPEDHTYGIWAHNLTSKEAPRDVDELRLSGLPAFTITQRFRHRVEDLDRCRSCAAEIAHAFGRRKSSNQKRNPKSTKIGGASCQVRETVSRITSSGTKSFSARPASSRNATSGSRLHLSSSGSAGPMQSATTHSLRTIF